MQVLKKINNNVVICKDGDQRQLIAFGLGIGFPATPYELTDLTKIERTFYDVDKTFIDLVGDIPVDIIRFVANQMQELQDGLPYETGSNLIITLADHIAFSIERARRNVHVQMPSIYEMEVDYPAEVAAGRKILAAIRRELKVQLPKSEIQGIAMHLINARDKMREDASSKMENEYDEVLEQTTRIIEEETGVQVRRDTFNYARFATHVRYLIKRIFQKKHVDSDNLQMYNAICIEYPKALACVDKINEYYSSTWSVELTEEEKLYLMIHVNRVCSKESD